MRIELNEARDEATVHFGDERQTHEDGATWLVLINDDDHPRADPVEVQIGFEDYERLIFINVRPASKALPAELLASATRV
jgi:hypothetical protein